MQVEFMRLLILLCLSVFFVSSVAVSQDAPEAECEIEKPKRKTVRKIDRWIKDSTADRSGAPKEKLLAELSSDEHNCRDVLAIEDAFRVLDLRDWSSTSKPESAQYILAHADVYELEYQADAIDFLIRYYKQTEQFGALVKIAQQPAVSSRSRTLLAARDAVVLSNFALGFEQETLDMVRPLAEQPVNARDWWLMTFSSALAEHLGEEELARTFQAKADGVFSEKRVLEIPEELEGSRVERMVQHVISGAKEAGPGRGSKLGSGMIRQPKPKYPTSALRRKESGYCDVVFDITIEGRTENVRAYCSSDTFVKEAERAIRLVRFRPHPTEPTPLTNIFYPIEFTVF